MGTRDGNFSGGGEGRRGWLACGSGRRGEKRRLQGKMEGGRDLLRAAAGRVGGGRVWLRDGEGR
jgi:hypothetical protein